MSIEVLPPCVASLSQWYFDDGDRVTKGDHIADVESMKTIFPIDAPATGVLRYKADLGDIVGEDDPLALIEGDPGNG